MNVRRKRIVGLIGAGVLAVGTIGVVTVIDTTAASAASSMSCAGHSKAVESVKIHSTASTSSTSLGLFPKGARACAHEYKTGGKYTACGGTSTEWRRITYKEITGYVADRCITPDN